MMFEIMSSMKDKTTMGEIRHFPHGLLKRS